VVDDSVHYRIVSNEGDDTHPVLAFGADKRINFIDLTANLGPAAAGNPGALLLDDQELLAFFLGLAYLPSMGIGI